MILKIIIQTQLSLAEALTTIATETVSLGTVSMEALQEKQLQNKNTDLV